MSLFDLNHVTQLNEIQTARLRRNQPGIGTEVEDLIRRLTSGGVAGKSDDVREAQAKRYWDLGVGTALGSKSFSEYLASIPAVPEALLADDASFPLLVLVETRIGLKRLCDFGNIAFNGNDETFVAFDARHAELTTPTWIRIQDGRKNRNRSVKDCRTTFVKGELGLTALQGVCTYLQHSTVVSEWTKDGAHVMDLSGSVRREHRDVVAYLCVDEGRAELRWYWRGPARSGCGSASRREC
jgi:hypothetical protein